MGSEHEDSLVGDDASNWLAGLDGNDTMIGDPSVASGNYSHDSMWGGAGDDLMYGGAGNDQMWGRLGDDRLTGVSVKTLCMAGIATISFTAASA
jgi:Ca2+-binding RTX toxin-like protein